MKCVQILVLQLWSVFGLMGKSMRHWNGHQICAIDVETSGLDPYWHEILQICILPLDSDLKPRRDVTPFYIDMAPEFPHRISEEALKVNRLNINRILMRGINQDKAKDLLEDWINKLGLPYTPSGFRKRIIPLAHNYNFDKPFIQRWLGIETYSDYFDSRVRDTMGISLFLNDAADMHAEKVPYSKNTLSWLASKLDVTIERAHDAMQDCIATAEVYRKLLQHGPVI